MGSDDDPTVREVYDAIAESYAEGYWDQNPYSAEFEFPATTDLIPDVRGRRVLDAGCGTGVYTEWLLDRDAEVVAVDLSPEMLAQTADLVGDRAERHQADLEEPLTFADDREFDGVVSGQVLTHVADWSHVFAEFARVLTPGGFVVFSVRHPIRDFSQCDDWSYFEVERQLTDWGVDTPHYARSFEDLLTPILEAGFRLDEVVEPRPTEAFREQLPGEYEGLLEKPHFLCIRAVKR